MCNRAGSSGFSKNCRSQHNASFTAIEWNTLRIPLNRHEWVIFMLTVMTCSGTGDFPANTGSIVVAGLPACLHKVLVPTLLTTTCIPRERCIHNFKHRISFHSN